MKNVIDLSVELNDATLTNPEMVIERVLEEIKTKSFKGKKVLVLLLDDTGEQYDVGFHQAGMTMSECLALSDTAKTLFLETMGYL